MISPITYSADEQAKIDSFKNLPPDAKKTYWDNTHDGILSNLKERIKSHYIETQDYTCPYCKQRIVVKHKATWDAEHIIPKDTHPNFMFEAENLCIACKDCNQEKWNKNVLVNKDRKTFPDDKTDYLIIHPHFDDYNTNIKIIGLGCFYLPKTDKGRKTVEICGLLRFLYKLADYDGGSTELDCLIGDLYLELRETNDAQQRYALLKMISDIALNGAKILIEKMTEERLKSKTSVAV